MKKIIYLLMFLTSSLLGQQVQFNSDIKTKTNWNQITRNGCDRLELNWGKASNGNGQDEYYYICIFEYITTNGTGNLTQVIYPYSSGNIWTRSRIGNKWGEWTSQGGSGGVVTGNETAFNNWDKNAANDVTMVVCSMALMGLYTSKEVVGQ